MSVNVILNESELRTARARLAKLRGQQSSEQTLLKIAAGFTPEIVELAGKMLNTELETLASSIEAYEAAKINGDFSKLQQLAGGDLGLTLIAARISKGYSQRDLAWRLGIKEQQVQRYESDRYNSISVKNYLRIAILLGVETDARIRTRIEFRGLDSVIDNASKESIKKILKHGRANDWFEKDMDEANLRRFIAENRIEFGSPSLLRTGLNVVDHSEDILLHAWRAQIGKKARSLVSEIKSAFDPLDFGWLRQLVALSERDDGPTLAAKLLLDHGIILVYEPQIPGLAIDGASFLEGEAPVIGVTLRKDTIDNFWYTLFHELGHAYLHYRTGLAAGFYDQHESESADQQENEANDFASNMLIPEERWRKSTARIARSPEIVVRFAKSLNINPAIVFGRIRKERNNYSIFADRIGQGSVGKQLKQRDNGGT